MSSPAPDDASAADDAFEQAQLRGLLDRLKADQEAFREAVRQDPGFVGDLEVFLSKTLDRFDGPLRDKFPLLNTLLASSVPIPIAPVLLSLILLAVENGGLSLIEAWLDSRRRAIERRAHPE